MVKTNQIPEKEKEAGATTRNVGLRVNEFLLLPPSGQTIHAKCHAASIRPSVHPLHIPSPRFLSLLVGRDVAANLNRAGGAELHSGEVSSSPQGLKHTENHRDEQRRIRS